MAKSKKKKQEDFQKVKLKVGKRLPKGQNVTNTSFKTHAIQVVQQLKTDGSQPSTHRKLNIEDLLPKCQHYSIGVRHDGVTGLRELMTLHPHMITSQLATIIEKALPLIMDKDSNVRQACLKLFKLIFTSTPAQQIEPFFPVLSAHLCCAMTHIYDDIQHDSLEVFDLLLDTYPLLIANNSGQLLQNFIEQISRQQNVTKGQKSNLSLAVKLDSKYSVQRWRSGILSRIYKLLLTLLMWRFTETSTSGLGDKGREYAALSCIPLQFPSSVADSWEQPGFKLKSVTATSVTSSKGDNFADFATALIPLLVQCWVECRSAHGQQKIKDNLVAPGSVTVMHHVMQVLHLLWRCLDRAADDNTLVKEVFGSHEKEFMNHFMTYFPYSIQDNVGHRNTAANRKNKKEVIQVTAEALNLSVCEVMATLVETTQDKTLSASIGDYLCACLTMEHLGPDLSKTLVAVLQQFLTVCSDTDLVESIVENGLARYSKAHPLSTEKRLYLELFTSLFLDSKIQLPNMRVLMDQFFQTLPELLPHVYSDSPQMAALVVRVMRQAACQRCRPLLDNLETSFVSILDVTDGLFIQTEAALQRGLLDTLYWVPRFTTQLLTQLVNVCHHGNVSTAVSLYLLDIVHTRFQREIATEKHMESDVTMTTNYLSFLLSIIADRNRLSFEQEKQDGCHVTSAPEIDWNVSSERWEKHTVMVDRVLHHLQQVPDVSGLGDVLLSRWCPLLTVPHKVCVTTILSCLKCLSVFQAAVNQSHQSLTDAVVKICISLTMEMVTMVPPEDNINQINKDLWECVSQCLVTVPSIINKYFISVNGLLQTCSEETVVTAIRSMVHVLQDQSAAALPRSVDHHLEAIQRKVKKCFPDVVNSQCWKDLMYCCSILTNQRSVAMSCDE
ncbi:testis-expressed protein 10 homolog [Haliotis rubra]|uniref:testis-expressed protein 10 homolog n=1 Tax=Haliotis rubra TaxID=36100 RepID=UPI001EE58892|nr:testis-expressed protein 10 homolog [Haliotis rubra]